MKKEYLWGWVFQYNPYINKYMAATRENYTELTNGDNGNILYGKDYEELERKIEEKSLSYSKTV